MELIDKAAVIAEIERRIEEYQSTGDDYWFPVIENLKNILSFLNTLEVKGVNLEKHLKEDIEDVYFDLNGVAVKGATYYLTVEDIKEIAKHFYELGLKAKGE